MKGGKVQMAILSSHKASVKGGKVQLDILGSHKATLREGKLSSISYSEQSQGLRQEEGGSSVTCSEQSQGLRQGRESSISYSEQSQGLHQGRKSTVRQSEESQGRGGKVQLDILSSDKAYVMRECSIWYPEPNRDGM